MEYSSPFIISIYYNFFCISISLDCKIFIDYNIILVISSRV